VEVDEIERVVSGLVRKLEGMGEQDVPSSVIGELAMDALKGLDPVAYVRFASVYRDFREVADFHEVLAEIAGKAGTTATSEAVAPPGAALAAGGKL
jgi:transcriptional repressor NrdR